jgi:hypothetical protein
MLRVRSLPFLAMLVCLTGCVPNKPYRPKNLALQNPPTLPGHVGPTHFKLGIVEFDDMGESWEKCTDLSVPTNCQLTRVLDLIKTEKQRTGDVVVVVFTHGWKNNASPENEREKNLYSFKELMEQLALGEDQRTAKTATGGRSYIGIYMGWRGESVRGFLDNTTFWNRRDAAQRVGGSDYAEAIYRIMGATKLIDEDGHGKNSKIVVVGHSFGARVLETALTNTFVSLLVPQPDANGHISSANILSPADLILYVNSANDSLRTKSMIELMKRTQFTVERGTNRYAGPLFLSVTSTGDTATGVAFPLGQDLDAISKSFRKEYVPQTTPPSPPQKTFFTHTPGHTPFLYSHQVRQITGPCVSSQELFRFVTGGLCYEMTPVPNRWNDSPYWVVTVPTTIIKNHTDIFNEQFSWMMIKLIDHYELLSSPGPTRMVKGK